MRKVSVIIAAYNVENYIHECLKSVSNQTLEDIEIIVCDDCSTDGTLNIIKAVAEHDGRIKVVVNEENKGLMLNRKAGVDISTGEYIMFLDGDDYYSLDACEKAYNAIKLQNVDILQFSADSFADISGYEDVVNGVNEYLKFPEEKIIVSENGELLNLKYTKTKMNYSIWSKIYRSNIIKSTFENLPDKKITLSEDILITTIAFYYSKAYGYIVNKLYNYRVGTGISTSTDLSDYKLEERAKSYYIYTYLQNWMTERGAAEICAERLEEIKMQMLHTLASTILEKVYKDRRQWYVDTALTYCPKEEFIAYLSFLVYGLKQYREEEYSKIIKSVSLFKADAKKIKTIGTFYHRMYNGGVEKVISQLSDIWYKKGYKVILFTDEAPNKNDYPLNDNTIRVILPVTNFNTYKEYLERTKVWINAIEEYNIDTMVYHAWLNLKKLSDVSAVKSTGIPFIVHTHGIFCTNLNSHDFTYAYRSSNQSYIYQCVDAVTALNDVDMSWWLSKGLRSYKTVNPVQVDKNIKPAELNGVNVIISSRIDPNKQIDHVIEIAHLVKGELTDVKFTIIGGCDDHIYRAKIEKMIKDYKLQDCVNMVGYVQNVTDYYQKADVMLSTSRFEGFSLALTEGKLCGLPLVCYFLANWDMARNPKGMVNIPQGDIHAAADAIIKILSDDEYRKELGRQARESGLEYLNTDIGKIWNDIFVDIEQNPFQFEDGVVIKEPLEAATDILAEFNAKGIEKRGADGGFHSQDLIYYQMQCNALDRTIKEIRESTAYRIGFRLTSIPRKIKNFIKR